MSKPDSRHTPHKGGGGAGGSFGSSAGVPQGDGVNGGNPAYSMLDSLVQSATTSAAEGLNVSDDDDVAQKPAISMAVLILIVVASLSLVVGAIYMLIYFKSIKPMSARSRSYTDSAGKPDGDEGGRTKSAHPFFRRK